MEKTQKFITYEVQASDTLTGLALDFDLSCGYIRKINGLYGDRIQHKKFLKFPNTEKVSLAVVLEGIGGAFYRIILALNDMYWHGLDNQCLCQVEFNLYILDKDISMNTHSFLISISFA